MKISGFTFIRNGTILGYPFIESINSILPICDEFIIAVGPSEDNTLARLRKIKSKKIKIIGSYTFVIRIYTCFVFCPRVIFSNNINNL